MNPPYRMPPQPVGTCGMYNDHPIPGTTASSAHVLNARLRTHSSKFPIERELVLSTNKNASKIPLMQDNRNTGIPLINRASITAIGPDLPAKQTQAWNHTQLDMFHTPVGTSISRNIVRFPEDVTALVERDGLSKEKETVKKSVSKTYHTLKDLISSKFKKEHGDNNDELNNVSSLQQTQQDHLNASFLPSTSNNSLCHPQANVNIWPPVNREHSPLYYHKKFTDPAENYNGENANSFRNSKTLSQSQLGMIPVEENKSSQHVINVTPTHVDGTDSDEGGFRQRNTSRINVSLQNGPEQKTQQNFVHSYHHNHSQPQAQHQHINYQLHSQTKQRNFTGNVNKQNTFVAQSTVIIGDEDNIQYSEADSNIRQQPDSLGHKQIIAVDVNDMAGTVDYHHQTKVIIEPEKDYEKNATQHSNIDSGRTSATYSSDRKGFPSLTVNSFEPALEKNKSKSDSEWIDAVDAELRNILEPGLKSMTIRPESTVSESASSMSPPLPPLSPNAGISNNSNNTFKSSSKNLKQEYGTDTYNRASKNPQPIGPSKGQPSANSIQTYMNHLRLSSNKKHEQNMLKKHLFGLDTDAASVTNTTRSLDLESLLGGPWEAGHSVSESETDGGLQQIRNQLEGLESMYSEVLKMLGNRMTSNDTGLRTNRRRRHGSMSSLPSSSISGRPIRDRKRPDERRKVRDIRGINKRFQRLESHVVTLARSVAHLSSEMRSQHLVSQELEELRNDLALLRSQSVYHLPTNVNGTSNSCAKEPINLTNPRRVKKLTKFFGEDPPLMKLFLKKLGYEKYAPVFDLERVGMIELPYLGEERLQKMGIPLGPRLRILQEAQISLCRDTTLCIV